MRLVFALGNPGSEFTGTRHNVGFMAIDYFANNRKTNFAEKAKFRAYVAEVSSEADKILLVKPSTFYNNVGESARALIDFYKLDPAKDLLVIHDDLVLPFGLVRVRGRGSDAGNNGIKSLNAHIGSDYARLRVGTYTEGRQRADDVDFVLSKFNSGEAKILKEKIFPKLNELIDDFTTSKLEDASYGLDSD